MTGHAIIRFLAAALLAVSLPAFGDAGAFQFVSGEVKIVRPDGREIVAVKGTKMAFAGVKKDQVRADLIAYLASLSDAPKPFPAP